MYFQPEDFVEPDNEDIEDGWSMVFQAIGDEIEEYDDKEEGEDAEIEHEEDIESYDEQEEKESNNDDDLPSYDEAGAAGLVGYDSDSTDDGLNTSQEVHDGT